jgi:uncharacterized protein YciI
MLYACICTDKPDTAQLRQDTRERHIAYLNELGGAVKSAGALLGDDGQSVVGSLIILEADSPEAARAMVDGDPFAHAGVFAKVDVRAWRWALGAVNMKA